LDLAFLCVAARRPRLRRESPALDADRRDPGRVLAAAAPRRRAAFALPGVGELCGGADVRHLAAQSAASRLTHSGVVAGDPAGSCYDGRVKPLGKIFLTGLLTVLPIVVTLYFTVWLLTILEGFFGKQLLILIPDAWYRTGMGLLVAVAVVFVVGLLMHGLVF